MKRLALVLFALSMLPACAGTKYIYAYRMSAPPSDTTQWGDDSTDWDFSISEDRIGFVLTNKTEDMLKVTWDEASLVTEGTAERVMHEGVKFNERNQTQSPTVIPPHASIEDSLIPTDSVSFYQGGYVAPGIVTQSDWVVAPLFPNRNLSRAEIAGAKGQKFTIYIPVDRNGQRKNYAFEFEVEDVYKAGEQPPAPPPPTDPAAARVRAAEERASHR